MANRKVSFAPGEYYHIYNRGNSKQKIFLDKQDHVRFLILLYVCNSDRNFKIFNLKEESNFLKWDRGKTLVSIGAYCLMPNHFHLLVTQDEDGDISKFMQKVCTAYVMYFNKKYDRTGGLFEGRFRSQHVDNDRYLKYLFSYIHLNPLKIIDKNWREKGINKNKGLDFLNEYKYSSYGYYNGCLSKYNEILNSREFPEYFPNKESFYDEIYGWMSYRDDRDVIE